MRRRGTARKAVAVLTGLLLSFAWNSAAARPQANSGTAAKKKKTKSSKRRGKRQRGQKAPTADRIREIQGALAKAGTYSRTQNGKWDAATVEALKKFQEVQGLNPTGKLDAKSLQKLGLGSDVAGVAAPMPAGMASTAMPEASRRRQ